MVPVHLEVPVFSPASAQVALDRASRIELNRAGSYPDGGLTPELASVQSMSAAPSPLRISKPFVTCAPSGSSSSLVVQPLDTRCQLTQGTAVIRPRGPPEDGPDFIYSPAEFDEMRRDIQRFRDSGYLRTDRGDGFVFGILEADSGGAGPGPLLVDAARNSELVRLASPLRCVFHRAFDEVLRGSGGRAPADEAVRAVSACGFDGVLTSGGPGSAADNLGVLERVVRAAAGERLEVIVGGGVRSSNARALRAMLPRLEGSRVWLHSSCLTNESVDVVDVDELNKLGDILS